MLLASLALLPLAAAAQDGGAADAGTDTDASTNTNADLDASADPDTDPAAAAPGSGVRGRIVDARTGEALPDAVVVATGEAGRGTAMTNETGGYVIVLPPGLYSVSALYDLYHGARMPRVRVRSARWADLTLTLDPIDDSVVAEEVEIVYRADTSSARAQDQLRAASSGIGEGMGAAQMSRSGASDAGSAARNVAGVSLEGANLNIRGLGGRYTLVLMNGVQLPSTDPDVPSVDLDLFPTSVIENLHIAKAFQPDLPGNFAGGVLDIRTVRFPRRFTFELEGGAGLNTLSTGRETFGYRGGDLDWLGFDDGTRALPSGLDERVSVTRGGPYQTFEAVEAIAERFPNNWALYDQTLGAAFGFAITLGDSIDLGNRNRFGYLATASYDYAPSFSPTRSARQTSMNQQSYGLAGGSTGEDVSLNALVTASLELGQDDAVSFLTVTEQRA